MITDYASLQVHIVGMLGRPDMAAFVPAFIGMAEAKFNRTIRNRQMEQRSTATATEYIALPDDYLELRRIQLNTSTPHPLTLLNPSQATFSNDATDEPLYYVLEANQIRLVPAPDTSYTVEIDYYKQIPALTGTATTNWLLTDHPDVYVYGTLLEAMASLGDQRLSTVAEQYRAAVMDLNSFDRRQRWSGGPMAQSPA